jgi:magnesium-transporting ATPase (P-type)
MRRGGVHVALITGDGKTTALAIAAQLGLLDERARIWNDRHDRLAERLGGGLDFSAMCGVRGRLRVREGGGARARVPRSVAW